MNVKCFSSKIMILILLCNYSIAAQVEMHDISFTGHASGGELVLFDTLNRNCRFVSIRTEPGETAESIANRLAEKINVLNPFLWMGMKGPFVSSVDGTLKNLVGSRPAYGLAGTELGLGIPLPPKSLSCSYSENSGLLKLTWINPPGDYDALWLILNWTGYTFISQKRISGNASSFVLDTRNQIPVIDINDLDIWLIGLRNNVPSNAAATHLSNAGKTQEERFGIPFTNGITPNWQLWTYGITPNKTIAETRTIENLTPYSNSNRKYAIKTPDAKPFKQILKTPAEGGTVGIWRQFLGLIPGHTYKISARLNTLDMDPNDPDWSYSFHAVPELSSATKLTEQQMAGLAVLPNGKSGLKAGRIAEFGQGVTTKGEYEMHSTEITLPSDSNSVTVWLRCSGKVTSGVGFEWIKLEDLGG